MTSILLSDTLDNLEIDDLKKFQWYLRTPGQSFQHLNVAQLPRDTSRTDTATVMVDKFGENAVDVTVQILEKMGKNNQAKELKDKYREGSQPVKTSVPDRLVDTLNGLGPADLTTFQWNLYTPGRSFKPLRKAKVDGATIENTVDQMVAKFREKAVDVTVEVLRRMDQDNLAQELVDQYGDV